MCSRALLPLVQSPPTQCSIANGLYVCLSACLSVCLSVCLSFQDMILSREVPQELVEDIVQVLLNLGMVRQEVTPIFNSSWPLRPVLPLPCLPSPQPMPSCTLWARPTGVWWQRSTPPPGTLPAAFWQPAAASPHSHVTISFRYGPISVVPGTLTSRPCRG